MSGPNSPAAPDPNDAEARRLAHEKLRYDTRDAKYKPVATMVSIIAGVLAAATALISIFAVNKSSQASEAQASVSQASEVIETLTSAADADASKLQAAQEIIESQSAALESQRQSTVTVTEPVASSTPTAAGADPIFHQGTVAMQNNGYQIELFADPSDPTWGASFHSVTQGALVKYADGRLQIDADGTKLKPGETPTLATCASKTTYSYLPEFTAADISDQPQWCFTNLDYFGTFRIVSVDGDIMNLELTIWQRSN